MLYATSYAMITPFEGDGGLNFTVMDLMSGVRLTSVGGAGTEIRLTYS